MPAGLRIPQEYLVIVIPTQAWNHDGPRISEEYLVIAVAIHLIRNYYIFFAGSGGWAAPEE